MAGEEDFGSARITVDLDESEAEADARVLGPRLQRALNRATRNLGRTIRDNISAGLRDAAVSVQVLPDLADFASRVRAALAGEGLTIPVAPDLTDFAARVQAALAGVVLTVQVQPDVADFAAAVRAQTLPDLTVPVQPDLDRLDRAIRGHKPPTIVVPVVPDLDRFDSLLLTRLRSITSINIPVAPDLTGFLDRIRTYLAGAEVSIRVVPDLDDFDARIRAHRPPSVTVDVDANVDRLGRALAGVSGIAGALGSLLRFAAVGIAFAAAAQGVAAFTAAVAPAAGVIAGLPAVIALTQAALGTLRLALSGVQEAFSAALTGSAEEFEKSLEGLSPAAQAAAREVRALKPAVDALRSSVQDAFFEPLKGQIEAAAQALGGPLKKGMTDVSGEFGRLASAALGFAQSATAVTLVERVFGQLKTQLGGIQTDTVDRLLAAVSTFVTSTLPAFNGLGDGIDGVANRFAAFLERASASGQALAWVQDGIAVLQQLGSIAGNVGGILSGVFGAADSAGGGLLNNLQTITAEFERFVQSAQGQESLGNIFGAVAEIAAQLGPIISALVTQIGGIAPQLTPIFTTLGPVIAGLVTQLGQAIQGALPNVQRTIENIAAAVTQLGPSLPGVAEALSAIALSASDLLAAAAPLAAILLDLLAPIVDIGAPLLVAAAATFGLVKAFAAVRAVIPLITGAWAALNAAFVASPIGAIVTAVVGLALAVYLLYQRFQPVRDVVDAVGAALKTAFEETVEFVGQVASAVGDFVSGIPGFFSALPGQITGFFAGVGQAILDFFTNLPGVLVGLLASLGQTILTALTTAGAAILTFFVNLPAQIGTALLTLTQVIVTSLVVGLAFAAGVITGFIITTVQFFIGLPAQIGNALVSLGSFLLSAFTTAFTATVNAVTSFVTSVIDFFVALPGRIVAAVTALPGLLLGVFNSAKAQATSVVSSTITAVVGFFASLPNRARSAASSLVGALSSVFTSAKNAVTNTVRSLVAEAVNFIRGLPGKAKAALGSLGSTLSSAGRDLVNGFVNGIKSAAGRVASAAKELVGKAKSAFTAGLEIFSPSRVTRGYGINVGQGFIDGMTSTESKIQQTADALVKSITDAFKGQRTTVDDALVRMVRAKNKQLQGLAKERDEIAQRIVDAQKFANDTLQSTVKLGALQNFAQPDGSVTTAGFISGLKNTLYQVKRFNKQVNDLAKRGLTRPLLQELIGLGPEQGAEIANALAGASKGTLAQINGLRTQLGDASRKFGRDSADILYDAGKRAGEGFLEGLKGQQKAIEQIMLNIAKGMQRSIRTALKIKSPSQVFENIGDLTGQGLEVGLTDRILALQRTVQAAAESVAAGVADAFATLPALITQSLGNINGKVLDQIKAGLPSSVRGLLPFADGGIIDRPVVGLLGEAGREVVIPMTRPARARELADESGLTALLAGGSRRRPGAGAGTVQNNYVTINEVGNARATAHRVVTRLALAGGL
ncbi:phage tail protein [Streptomyces parvulus]|uniref:phage tail protein n=1 Tax=Streptomyces parvulus TaxID=146923 RepID=UPI00382AAAB0